MGQPKKSQFMTFRLTDEELAEIESTAAAAGEKPRDWCRRVVLERVRRERGLTRNERLIFNELARVRYLVGYGFGMLADDTLTPQEWEQKRHNADQRGAEIAQVLLDRQHTNGHA